VSFNPGRRGRGSEAGSGATLLPQQVGVDWSFWTGSSGFRRVKGEDFVGDFEVELLKVLPT
jgi:hypothetical protein